MAQFHILTKPGCPHCDRAKAAITAAGFTYSERVYDTPEQIAAFKADGFKTFPQVYHGAQHIGGADDTEAWFVANSDSDDF